MSSLNHQDGSFAPERLGIKKPPAREPVVHELLLFHPTAEVLAATATATTTATASTTWVLKSCSDVGEESTEGRARYLSTSDDRQRDQRSNQSILDGGRARLILRKAQKRLHFQLHFHTKGSSLSSIYDERIENHVISSQVSS
jgi:hypothetical protein